jgi:8-oxo-dGTP pyrophosphatase MutT (NUDIX family)
MTLAERLRSRMAALNGTPPTQLNSGDDVHWVDESALVPAAVLVAVTNRQEPGVLLTLRTANLRKHAGQVAFPGGRIDPGDDGPTEAALREANEEIGLAPDQAEIVGVFDTYRTGTGYLVTPVMAVIPPDLPLSPHAAEVDAIFETPLAHLLDPANYDEREAEWNGRVRRYRELYWQDYRIWGATAGILANVAFRLGDWR